MKRNHGGRYYCDPSEDTYCGVSTRYGCVSCQDEYFRRDTSSACVSCDEQFGGACNECDDFYGCTECADGFTLMYDDDCGLRNVDFGYCAPNSCDDDTTTDDENVTYSYVDNTLENTPIWLYGYSAVGKREGVITPKQLSTNDNMGVSHRDARRYPLPCPAVWSIFDNYLEFQQLITTHRNDTHFSGPHNEVGEIVTFLGIFTSVFLHFFGLCVYL